MSLFHSNSLVGASGQGGGGGGYTIDRSVRFNAPDSAYLSRTPSSASNRRTFTWSGWIKRSALGTRQSLISAGTGNTGGAPGGGLYFNSSTDTLSVVHGGGTSGSLETAQVFRDVSAWFHIVIAYDTTQVTPSNRIKIYVNGSQISISGTYPDQNFQTDFNNTVIHAIGSRTDDGGLPASTADYYLAEVFFIDGQALTPSSFGETDTNNAWIPKQYTGTYGTNGYRLNFSNNATSAALGTDTSGNSNTWTVNNISVTSGIGNDSLRDSPTNGSQTDTGLGGEVSGNYCVLNPLTSGFGSGTLTQGNLYYALTSSANQAQGTIAVRSGKWWWEAFAVSGTTSGTVGGRFGFCIPSEKNDPEQMYFGLHWHATSGLITVVGNTFTQRLSGTNYQDGDTLGCALDADSNIAYFYKNGSLVYTYDFSSFVTAGTRFLTPHAWNASSGTPVWSYNFGQRAWSHTPRTGHKALCTGNMSSFAINNGSAYVSANTYSGNDSTQVINNGFFNPDVIWLACRNGARNNRFIDVVRGVQYQSFTQGTDAGSTYDATSYPSSVTSTNSTGFTVDNNTGIDAYNTSGETYAAWTWESGSSTVTNNQGSISCQLRANPTAGISFATYSVSSSGQSIGHGLGVAPNISIVKGRSTASDWYVRYNLQSGQNGYVLLNSQAGGTSSFSANATTVDVGYTGGSHTWFMWNLAQVPGFSAINSYTGNNSSDGVFVYTGFRVKWFMVKRLDASDTSAAFRIFDSTRSSFNKSSATKPGLVPSEFGTESEYNAPDFLANGFKWRTTDANVNGTGQYLYIAFAENPITIARAF